MQEIKRYLRLAFSDERYEVGLLKREVNVLKKLQASVESGGVRDVKGSILQLQSFFIALSRTNEKFLNHLLVLEESFPKDERISQVENEVKAKFLRISELLSPSSEIMSFVVDGRRDDVSSLVPLLRELRNSILDLLATMKEADEDFKDIRKNYRKLYKKIITSPQEKIVDLLAGKGKYKDVDLLKRNEIWKRWKGMTRVRVLKGKKKKPLKLSGLELAGFDFREFKFENVDFSKSTFTKHGVIFGRLGCGTSVGVPLNAEFILRVNMSNATFCAKRDGQKLGASAKGLKGLNFDQVNFEGMDNRSLRLIRSGRTSID